MNIYISLIITMVFSAFFSGVEIAFVSVDKLRFEMERKGGITSRILSIFFKNPNEFKNYAPYLAHTAAKSESKPNEASTEDLREAANILDNLLKF